MNRNDINFLILGIYLLFILEHYGDRTKLFKLNKAIYGLKQSSRLWQHTFVNVIKNFGFKASEVDPCLFIQKENYEFIFIILYVDDFGIVANSLLMANEIYEKIAKHFVCKNLGQITQFLACKITRNWNTRTLTMSQPLYIRKILKRFNINDMKISQTPLRSATDKETKTGLNDKKLTLLYQQMVGSLMHLAVMTRPDICTAVNKVSRKSHNPNFDDLDQVYKIFHYLNKTKNYGLILGGGSNKLTAFVDADFGSDRINDRKSTSGFVIKFGIGTFLWKSKIQNISRNI